MTQKSQARRGLGRGLGSLIPTAPRPEDAAEPANGSLEDSAASTSGFPSSLSADSGAWDAMGDSNSAASRLQPVHGAYFAELPVGAIMPNPRQPRQVFDEEAMAELVLSVTEVGLLQPVVVRPRGSSYELIAGERRWRAVQRLGWTTIPAVPPTSSAIAPVFVLTTGRPRASASATAIP